jgi:hypothetical protein
MKKIYYLALSALLFAACSKDEKEATPRPQVNNTIYGRWDLLATAQPFSGDTSWKYIKRAEDMTSLHLFENKTYFSLKHPDKKVQGTFTVIDSAGTNIKKVILSNEGEPVTLYLQVFDSGLLKVDDETFKKGEEGYISKRYGRWVECRIIF